MHRRAKILCVVGLTGIAAMAGWRLWRATAPAKIVLDDAEAVIAGEAGRWLQARMAAVAPIASAEAFEVPTALEAARPMLAEVGLSVSDGQAAVAHAAAMMHRRFVVRDFDAYTRWREEMGYRFFPAERLRQEPVMYDAITLGAGRALRDDEADTKQIWQLYWKNVIEPSAKVVRMDQTAEGSVVLAWKNAEGLALRKPGAPARRAVGAPIATSTPAAPGRGVGLWRGARAGQGWPVWFPPDDVEVRLEAPGTPFVEVAWILQLDDGKFQPFVLDLGMDRQTRRWWTMQWYIPHAERGININTGGL